MFWRIFNCGCVRFVWDPAAISRIESKWPPFLKVPPLCFGSSAQEIWLGRLRRPAKKVELVTQNDQIAISKGKTLKIFASRLEAACAQKLTLKSEILWRMSGPNPWKAPQIPTATKWPPPLCFEPKSGKYARRGGSLTLNSTDECDSQIRGN